MHVKSLDHIHIYAADPDASAAFYQRHFAATPVQRNEDSDGRATVILALGGRIVLLGGMPAGLEAAAPPDRFAEGSYAHGFGVAHFGLRVDDVPAAVRELETAAVGVLEGPVVEPDITYAYVAAPDGVVLELTQYETPGD